MTYTRDDLIRMLDEAQTSSTPPERLRFIVASLGSTGGILELRDPYEDLILAEIASHPNAPPEVLAKLAEEYPEAVASNPVFPMLPLEMPDLMQRFSFTACLRLLAVEDLPLPVVAAIAALPWWGIAETARMHVTLVGEAGADWQEEVRDYWRAEVDRALLNKVRRQGLVEAVELGLLPEWVAGPEPWPAPGVSYAREQFLQQVRAEGNKTALRCVLRALDPDTGPETLLKCSAQLHRARYASEVAMAILLNPAAPAKARHRAAFRSEMHQILAASDPHSEPELLAELAERASFPWIRRLVWRHPNTTPTIRDRAPEIIWGGLPPYESRTMFVSPLVIFAVVQSPLLSERSRQEAAHAEDWWYRLAAALSLPAGGSDLLDTLCRDGNRLVRAAARARLAGAAPLDLSE